ncbi:alcohol oxidase [Acephala macrosclerotiorum]|nr:alcohol oxidase [Acephala macrosclerotiorum]
MQSVPPADPTPPHPTDTSSISSLSDSYDFIVVGGGTAGLCLAARLTEDPKITVLVIEAGANKLEDPKILTPGLGWAMYDNAEYDWCLETVPQQELNDRVIPHQRGKVLGGSSCIYQLQMVYSSQTAVNGWEKMGNPGWNWETMLPYFRKFHSHHPPEPTDMVNDIRQFAYQDEAVESSEGPVQTSYSETTEIDKSWYETWKRIMTGLGYDRNDLGGFTQPAAIDSKTRTRSFAGSAFYSLDIASRPNLRVVTEALAEKVVFNPGAEITASGVRFLSNSGEYVTVKAKKEVILSAGSLKSPQILELSGIGNAKLLKQRGVDVVVDNPNVGENLQDHQFIPVSFEVADGVQTGDAVARDPKIFETLLAMYDQDRSGPLGQNFIAASQFRLPETFGPKGAEFIPSLLKEVAPHPSSEVEALRNRITAELLSSSTVQHSLAKAGFNIGKYSKITDMTKNKMPGDYFTIFIALNHPFTRGNIHIVSSSPNDPPLIDPKYLSHPMDLELLARHVQFLSTLISTPPFSNYIKPDGRRIPTYSFANGAPSLDEAKKICRDHMISNYHPAGSCMMGKKEMGGVVDERLRVHGVKNLRVVDAGIFPLMPRGNIITSVYATAERAADLIKEDWQGR